MRSAVVVVHWGWLVTVFCSVSPAAEDARQWTSTDGKYTVRAQLVDFDEKAVQLRREDGRVIRVPLAKLSHMDRQYLAQSRAKPPAEPSEARYRVPGRFSIATPDGGFEWKEMKIPSGAASGPKVQVFTCVRADADSPISLTVEERPSQDDGVRVATVKGHYNGLIESLQAGGFTNPKGDRPPINGPVPDEVRFFLTVRAPDGRDLAIAKTILFKNRIYGIQAIAATTEEAKELIQIAKTLEEESGQPALKEPGSSSSGGHTGRATQVQGPGAVAPSVNKTGG